MRSMYDVIVRPIVTEKSTNQLEDNAYSFVVAQNANKVEIGKAVESLFDVKVDRVRTMRFRGKERRMGRHIGRRPSWKKAIVTLREGETIDVFEGV